MGLLFIFVINFNLAFIPDKASISEDCLTSEEVELFNLINAYRETIDLEPIRFSQSLSKVAKTHSRDLAKNYTYKQNAKCNPHSWSKKGSWTSCCYTSDHKKATCMWNKPREIAGFDSNGYEILYYSSAGAGPGESLVAWQNSPAHHPVMINSGIWAKVKWGSMGVGIYETYSAVWFAELEDEESKQMISLCN